MLTPAPVRIVHPDPKPGLVIAGFDPGIASPAVTVVREKAGGGYEYLGHRVIKTTTADSDVTRYGIITDALCEMLRTYAVATMVIEEQRTIQVGKQRDGEFNGNNGKTLISYGCAIASARIYRVKLIEVRAQTVKIAVLGKGNGNAEKKQVQAMVQKILGVKLPQDASDAAAMAIHGFQLRRFG